jgi:hypothetical protein
MTSLEASGSGQDKRRLEREALLKRGKELTAQVQTDTYILSMLQAENQLDSVLTDIFSEVGTSEDKRRKLDFLERYIKSLAVSTDKKDYDRLEKIKLGLMGRFPEGYS